MTMFFLFGMRTKAKAIGQIERPCSKCARPTMHVAIESRRWFTLFFIPLIPLRRNYVVRCGVFGFAPKASSDLKDQFATNAIATHACAPAVMLLGPFPPLHRLD